MASNHGGGVLVSDAILVTSSSIRVLSLGMTRGKQLRQAHCTHKQFRLLSKAHLRSLVVDTVQAFNDSWLLPSAEGEVFESGKARLARLQGFALSRGFAIVTTASGAGRFRFGYIHNGNKSKTSVSLCRILPRNEGLNCLPLSIWETS